jgi:predicted nucleic acid-binding protein
LSREEFNLAREMEKESGYEISFYDFIHILLAKKTNSILITRDKKLLEFSKKYSVLAKRPEEVL